MRSAHLNRRRRSRSLSSNYDIRYSLLQRGLRATQRNPIESTPGCAQTRSPTLLNALNRVKPHQTSLAQNKASLGSRRCCMPIRQPRRNRSRTRRTQRRFPLDATKGHSRPGRTCRIHRLERGHRRNRTRSSADLAHPRHKPCVLRRA